MNSALIENHYLLQRRLAVAKHILAYEQKSVAETALAVGYKSASGFSTAFSREMGVSQGIHPNAPKRG
jgi:AraC-like DNA-binding protein